MASIKNYFSHDSDARNSDKLINVRMELGAEGYGIYFMILERLREEEGYKSKKDYNMIAFDLRVESEKVRKVVEEFNLFIIDDDYFYSDSFLKRMEIKDKKTKRRQDKARDAALKRWNKEETKNAVVMQTQCQSSANAVPKHAKEKESKEKESKEKESKEKESKRNKNKENTTESSNAPAPVRRDGAFVFKSLIVEKYGDNQDLLNTFHDFILMRKSIKKPLTERAVKILFSKLDKLSNGNQELVIAMLEQSIFHSWQGVFELKGGADLGINGLGSKDRKTQENVKGNWGDLYGTKKL